MMRGVLTICLIAFARQASAQSGCEMVSSELDSHFIGLGTPEGAQIAQALGNLEPDVIFQLYADTARDLAKALDRARPYTTAQVSVLDNLTGVIDCFMDDSIATVLIDGAYEIPFTERFSNQSRLALLDALYNNDATAPVIGCIRGGQC